MFKNENTMCFFEKINVFCRKNIKNVFFLSDYNSCLLQYICVQNAAFYYNRHKHGQLVTTAVSAVDFKNYIIPFRNFSIIFRTSNTLLRQRIYFVIHLSRKFYFAHSLLLKQLSGFLYAKIGMEQSPFRRGNAEPYKYVRRRHTRKRLVMSQRR